MTTGLIDGADGVMRCSWPGDQEDYRHYHDHEWGRPVADDRRLFEKICLEGFQSGLSWLTILRKRENFRAAFAGFDFDKVAAFGAEDVERLLQDAGIVRHRGKIESTINNARRAQELIAEAGSLAAWFWRFEPSAGQRPPTLDRTHPRHARQDRNLDADLEGIEEARLELRRPDHGLRLHAGDGPGQRPHRGLPLPRGDGARARCSSSGRAEAPIRTIGSEIRGR